MPLIRATARKLKVTAILEPGAFGSISIADGSPARTELIVDVGGRRVTADVATKAIRKAAATLREHGADGCVLMLQGVLTAENEIAEAGLVAQPKVKPTVQEQVKAAA